MENSRLSKLEEAIKNRANKRVQERIGKFKTKIMDALKEIRVREVYCSNGIGPRAKEVLALLNGPDAMTKFPEWLWEDEENDVRDEMFAAMDEVQRAFAERPPSPDDAVPFRPNEKREELTI